MIGMSIKRISVLNLYHVLKPFVKSTPGYLHALYMYTLVIEPHVFFGLKISPFTIRFWFKKNKPQLKNKGATFYDHGEIKKEPEDHLSAKDMLNKIKLGNT